jgi:hypothetical protein
VVRSWPLLDVGLLASLLCSSLAGAGAPNDVASLTVSVISQSGVEEASRSQVLWVHHGLADLAEAPDGQVSAVLTRGTAVESARAIDGWSEVSAQGWVRTDCLTPLEGDAAGNPCLVVNDNDTSILDAPWFPTWGGADYDLGAEIGRVVRGTRVACSHQVSSTTRILLKGWMRSDALTRCPDSLGCPELCETISIQAMGDSTSFRGIMKWLPGYTSRAFLLVLYDGSGDRILANKFCLEAPEPETAVHRGVAFDFRMPVGRESFTTYRVALPTSGILGLFR